MADDYVLIEQRSGATWLTMNRPDNRNALGREMVRALRDAFAGAAVGASRAVVLAGNGPVFCAGADVSQYRSAFDREQVIAEGAALFDLLDEIVATPKPVIARVQRAAFGGAMGLIAACDLVVAADDTRFSYSEARLGLVPAVIGKATVRAIGPRRAKALMLLAEPFGSETALQAGLIHRSVPADHLDDVVDEWLSQIDSNAPTAMRDIKHLIDVLAGDELSDSQVRERVVALAADRRESDEGQEGLGAFLEKRRAAWVRED